MIRRSGSYELENYVHIIWEERILRSHQYLGCTRLASNSRMVTWFRKDFDGRICTPIEVLSWEGLRKTTISVKIADVPTDIRTDHRPNTHLKSYHCCTIGSLSRDWLQIRFGLVTGFIGHFQNVTTNNYDSFIELHTQNITLTTEQMTSFRFSLAVAW
jgi:hypothetical protein